MEISKNNSLVYIIGDDYIGDFLLKNTQINKIFFGSNETTLKRASRYTDIQNISKLTPKNTHILDKDYSPSFAIIATSDDSSNFLYSQKLKLNKDINHILVRVNNPKNTKLFRDKNIDTLCSTEIVGSSLIKKFETYNDF